MHQGFISQRANGRELRARATAHHQPAVRIVSGNARHDIGPDCHWGRLGGGEIGRRDPAQLVAILDPRPFPRKVPTQHLDHRVLLQIANIGGGRIRASADVQRVAIRNADHLHHLGRSPQSGKGQAKGEKRHMRSGEETGHTDNLELKRISQWAPRTETRAAPCHVICSSLPRSSRRGLSL